MGQRKGQLRSQQNSAMREKTYGVKARGWGAFRYLSAQKSSSCCGVRAGSPEVLLEAKSHSLVMEVSPDWGG